VSDCLPCDLEAAEPPRIVYRDDDWSCEIADGFDVPGWFILRLRRHAEGWAGPTADELAEFGPVSQRVATAVQTATGATGVYFMSFGENYPPFHFLVIARDADLPVKSRSAAILATRADGRDLAASLAVGERVRSALAATSTSTST
jgi:diadenosine tetraphosphate (Ap4A) HIT family hydrolase